MTMAPPGAREEPREEPRSPEGRPRADDMATRKPLPPWDRIKFLLLLLLVWFVLVWSVTAAEPLVGFLDAMRIELTADWWVLVLFGLEVCRQIHFLISEHWA